MGKYFEDTDKKPFVSSGAYFNTARELADEGKWGTADTLMKALAFADGNVGRAKKIKYNEDYSS